MLESIWHARIYAASMLLLHGPCWMFSDGAEKLMRRLRRPGGGGVGC